MHFTTVYYDVLWLRMYIGVHTQAHIHTFVYNTNSYYFSDCALAIVQSEQWEDAMRLCTPWENYTPMRLLVQNMPGELLFISTFVYKCDPLSENQPFSQNSILLI